MIINGMHKNQSINQSINPGGGETTQEFKKKRRKRGADGRLPGAICEPLTEARAKICPCFLAVPDVPDGVWRRLLARQSDRAP